MDSYKQPEDFGREGMEGWFSLLVGIKKGKYNCRNGHKEL